IGNLDCNGSGCHTTANVNAGGFKLGTASMANPTLTVAGHGTVAGAVAACATCHESAPYVGMLASSSTMAGDSRPTALDAKHPTSGDCGNCHVTTPTFATDLLPTAPKPANHIPTTAVCAQCHTTAGNFALYSVTGTHQGVSGCLTCHGPTVGPFAAVTLVSPPLTSTRRPAAPATAATPPPRPERTISPAPPSPPTTSRPPRRARSATPPRATSRSIPSPARTRV